MNHTLKLNDTSFYPHVKAKDIVPEQIRAARSMVGWTRSVLAKKANLSAETIKNTEHGVYSPKEETMKAIRDVFEKRGINFVCHEATAHIPADGETPGKTVKIYYVGITSMTVSVSENMEGNW